VTLIAAFAPGRELSNVIFVFPLSPLA
jgi:hypothetical protein